MFSLMTLTCVSALDARLNIDNCHIQENLKISEEIHTTESKPSRISGFSLQDVIMHAKSSDLGYKLKKGEIKEHQVSDFKEIHTFSSDKESLMFGDNSGYIGVRKDGKITLAFTGTTSLKNAMTDLRFLWGQECGGIYHGGILNAYKDVQSNILDILNTLAINQNVSLFNILENTVITGHSLGGGMALIAADMFIRQGYQVEGVAAYAAPHVMHHETAKDFDEKMRSKTLIVEQFSDPVPLLMPYFYGAMQVGNKLSLPYSTLCAQHKMMGYINALEALNYNGSIKTTSLFNTLKKEWTYHADSCKNTILDDGAFGLCSWAFRTTQSMIQEATDAIFDIYKNVQTVYSTVSYVEKKTCKREPEIVKPQSLMSKLAQSVSRLWKRTND